MEERVVLINRKDEFLGTMEKQKAHELGVLHRAFSIFLFNQKGEMLLQQRAASKYHSPLLWTNACCSHPRLNESYADAANRRLKEELGITCQIEEVLHFIYKAEVGEGLTEHELDRVFVGHYDDEFKLNPDEVAEIKYIKMETLRQDIQNNPEQYTTWFRIIFDRVDAYFKENIS